MDKWEYRTFFWQLANITTPISLTEVPPSGIPPYDSSRRGIPSTPLTSLLNQLGEQGWELVGNAGGDFLIFKRRKP